MFSSWKDAATIASPSLLCLHSAHVKTITSRSSLRSSSGSSGYPLCAGRSCVLVILRVMTDSDENEEFYRMPERPGFKRKGYYLDQAILPSHRLSLVSVIGSKLSKELVSIISEYWTAPFLLWSYRLSDDLQFDQQPKMRDHLRSKPVDPPLHLALCQFDVIASFLAASYPRWLSGEQLASALQDAETGIENEWIQRTNTSTAPCPIDVCHEQIRCVRGAKLLLEGLLSEAIDRQYVHVDKSMTTTLGLINSADYFGDDDDDDDNLSAHATPLYSRWFPCCKRRRFSSSLRSTFGCGWLFPSSYR